MEESLRLVIEAVDVALDPTIDHKDRNRAYEVCEKFRATCDDAWTAGVFLITQSSLSTGVRLFGGQLAQHAIEHQLGNIHIDEITSWQQTVLQLISLNYCSYSPALSKAIICVVGELVKKTWPQQWKTLMADLTAISQTGTVQLELVLLLFGRLGEDVSSLDRSLHQKRRQELVISLHKCMSDIFDFIISTIQQQLGGHTSNVSLIQAALNALSAYLDWAELDCVFGQDRIILRLLTHLLTEKSHQMLAADCLLTVVKRKGRVVDQKPVLTLFGEELWSILYQALLYCLSSTESYPFLKRLCEVIVTLGTTQLCILWGNEKEPGIERPENFLKYLQAMLSFLEHPSQTLNMWAAQLWLSFLKHEHISQDDQLQSLLPDVIRHAASKLMRVGNPSCDDTSDVGNYSRMDFEEAGDFVNFFATFRCTLVDVIRLTASFIPTVAQDLMTHQLMQLLSSSSCKVQTSDCTTEPSLAVLAWEAFSCFLDCIVSVVIKSSPPEPGIRSIEALLSSCSVNPSVFNHQLSCLHALCPYVRVCPDLAPQIMKMLFLAVEFKDQPECIAESRSVISLRRHACSIVISVARDYYDVMKVFFDDMYSHVIYLSQNSTTTYAEIAMLVEAVMTLSKHVEDLSKRVAFFSEVLSPVQSVLMSEDMERILSSSPSAVLKHFGLCDDLSESEQAARSLRAQVVYSLKILLVSLKQSHVIPNESHVGKSSDISFNSLLLNLVECVTLIGRALTAMWLPEVVETIHPVCRNVMDLLDRDKLLVLGLSTSSTGDDMSTDSHYRLHCQLFSMFELVFTCIGAAGQFLNPPIQVRCNAARHLLATTFSALPCIPNYHVRTILKVALRGLILYCPTDAVVPFLDVFLPPIAKFMLERLSMGWEEMRARTALTSQFKDSEGGQAREEAVNDRLLVSLTRDYIDFLESVLYKRQACPQQHENDSLTDYQSVDVNMDDATIEGNIVSDLGKHIMSSQETCHPVVLVLFSCLTWLDNLAAMKAARVISSVCMEVLLTSTDEVAAQLFTTALQALQYHGQQANVLSALLHLILKLYQLWGTRSAIVVVLQCVPNVGEEELKILNKLCLAKECNDKQRRQRIRQLKDILFPIVGRSLSYFPSRANQDLSYLNC
ncbi:exportin-5-like isoform X2 [Corticium candelabrum]|uniref:exportin-5-like isoform X2 n=1 Tax=Corticium candelabrum TaxID=121492 RepID=UPI002E25DE4D|nr:exportin-5-like isoform X2 [Corticium candelabrum]